MSDKSLKRRNAQLKDQLDREREARLAHLQKVTDSINEWKARFQLELDRYAALQAKYDELLFKYLEVVGDEGAGLGGIVPEEGAVPDEEGREVGPSQAVEEASA